MKVRINNNQPTAKQRKVLKEQCRLEFHKLLEKYEVMDDDVPDICEIKLRECGIDINEFFDE